ncbi:glycosyltransferase family 2 protein [Acinetobacter lactucae]|uniref:glycosyltransferase family 2 protein n=1 Tax=Acinetobacter lactucae TaxID=1785128 RepID=UPI00077E1237|nr:glycosyltransferase family 2 protein [Acinetobacter lactucae]
MNEYIYISIGIPIYNAQKYLADTIKSVIAQSHPYWELILIDDGSTDNSLSVAQLFAEQDSRIRIISDGQNRKLPFRLNQIVQEAKYEYIARMDADDIMHPQRLEKQLNFLEKNKKYDLVSSGLISIDNHNKVKGFRCVGQLYDDFSEPSLSYPIVHPSVMARKSWYERNQYSLEYPRAEDFELWTRAIKSKDFKMAVLPDLLLYYREEGNLSIDKIINSYKDTLKIYSKYHSLGNIDIEVLKLNFKIIISKLFYYTGNLQKLAMRRNTSFNSRELLENFQELLNQVVGED